MCFSFSQTERDEITKVIKNLKTIKVTQSTDIPIKPIKENSDIFADLSFENPKNYIFHLWEFRQKFRKHMNKACLTKCANIENYFKTTSSKYQYGFRRGLFSVHHCLLAC